MAALASGVLIAAAPLVGWPAGHGISAGTKPVAAAAAASETAPDAGATAGFPTIAILCYHDVGDSKWQFATAPDTLRAHLRLAKANGWTFMRLSDLVAAREHPETLPARVMVLTFDDGYRSFLTRALPILREEHVPATLAIVSDFVAHPPTDTLPIMSWREIVALDHADDVEVVSHSHALHDWARADPQGDMTPSVTTRRYLAKEGRYEDRGEYAARIRKDMEQSRKILRSKLHRDVNAYVWPYGEINDVARAIAVETGFTTSLVLGDRTVTREDLKAGVLPRFAVRRGEVTPAAGGRWPQPRPVLAVQADLDAVWNPDKEVFERNVARLIEQARRVGATHVFLQACPDPKGDGFLNEAWFMSHQAPVHADIWTFVATRFRRAGFRVWVRVPSMNLGWVWQRHPDWRIPFRGSKRGVTPWYFRISPDLPEARRAALDFYGDIAVYLPIDGILFDDDAYMLPGERLRGGDSSPAAKAAVMREHLEAIKAVVRAWRPQCQFGRNLYAPVVESPGVSPQLSQDLDETLRNDDLAVVMAYATMEGHAGDAERWVGSLARTAVQRWQDEARRAPAGRVPAGDPPIMFKLQAYDWEKEAWVSEDVLLDMAREARAAGITSLGVYPVLPNDGEPPADLLHVAAPAAAPARQAAGAP